MAATVEGSIELALEGRLQSLATSPALPISWTGKPFTPPANGKYLQVIYAPNGANRLFIGSTDPHQHIGILQLNLHWPHGDFERVPRDVAGQVAAHFPTDLVLTADGISVRITKRPDVGPALTGTTEITIPIMVEWEAYA